MVRKLVQYLSCLLFLSGVVHAGLGTVKVAGGFDRPVWAGMPVKSGGKLWVIEQAGKVWIVDLATGERSEKPFLDIEEDVSRKHNEEGLLGLAFSPDYESDGRYYVNFTDRDRYTRIVRFTANGETTDPASAEVLLRFKQPYGNHNGGWIEFGPDGMLYIGTGDGGAANDPKGAGQRLDTYLGKLLRIDVSGDEGYEVPEDNPFRGRNDARPEIWAYGLRNPWRCSFDRKTGDLWIGDVGQNHWEEINFMAAGKGAGANYGWRLREGLIATPKQGTGGKAPVDAVDPVYVYKHGSGDTEGLSVTGGVVYRGDVPALQGRYIFADFQNPRIWSFALKDGKAADFRDHSDEFKPEGDRIRLVASFAEDNAGNVYLVDLAGSIFRITGD
ncbi:MAG: PQQ-dependent sugar dehydrogenase [Verrucomicrobiales bacterium]|nr:PQQ-dependent sugar dehydrogenase [Verrucomicrobiota bacterium JB025]